MFLVVCAFFCVHIFQSGDDTPTHTHIHTYTPTYIYTQVIRREIFLRINIVDDSLDAQRLLILGHSVPREFAEAEAKAAAAGGAAGGGAWIDG